jgi:hypothetical protein
VKRIYFTVLAGTISGRVGITLVPLFVLIRKGPAMFLFLFFCSKVRFRRFGCKRLQAIFIPPAFFKAEHALKNFDSLCGKQRTLFAKTILVTLFLQTVH